MRRFAILAVAFTFPIAACTGTAPDSALAAPTADAQLASSAVHHGDVASGQSIFRFVTFGDETFWTDTLRMHEVIAKAVSPKTALSVGLKVDAAALPAAVVHG